jgi:hypothetical protein
MPIFKSLIFIRNSQGKLSVRKMLHRTKFILGNNYEKKISNCHNWKFFVYNKPHPAWMGGNQDKLKLVDRL